LSGDGPGLDVADQHLATQFLYAEAALLDRGRYREWLGLLDPGVRYRMPVAVTRGRRDPGESPTGMDHFDEDLYTLTKRVERLETEHAWTEDPPSRTRRFVTNVRGMVGPGGDLEVGSYVLLFRSRGDTRPPEWLSMARDDVLRRQTDGGVRLRARHVTVDEAVLRTQNLAVFV
jgi:phthalate 3,4-dioxygenase subunit beta